MLQVELFLLYSRQGWRSTTDVQPGRDVVVSFLRRRQTIVVFSVMPGKFDTVGGELFSMADGRRRSPRHEQDTDDTQQDHHILVLHSLDRRCRPCYHSRGKCDVE